MRIVINDLQRPRLGWLALALALGWGVGQIDLAPQATAQVGANPGHFKSGSERSELVLREIADTLRTMDARLERLEAAAAALAKPAERRSGF